MMRLRIPAMIAAATGGALITGAILAAPVYADYESRDRVLSESGVHVALFGLLLVAALVVLAAFAAANLMVGTSGYGGF